MRGWLVARQVTATQVPPETPAELAALDQQARLVRRVPEETLEPQVTPAIMEQRVVRERRVAPAQRLLFFP